MRVLIVDDHEMLRAGVSMLVQNTPGCEEIVECGSLNEALEAARGQDVGLVVLDLGLPDSDGVPGVVKMRAATPETPILVVSADHERATIEDAFAAGANGFLPKDSSAKTLRSALQTVLSGDYYVPPHVIRALSEPPPAIPAAEGSTTPVADEAEPEPVDDQLTPRQRDVFVLLARGLANKEIACELDMSPSTVRVHVTAILRALGVENRTQAATHPLARQLGN